VSSVISITTFGRFGVCASAPASGVSDSAAAKAIAPPMRKGVRHEYINVLMGIHK
jgi:hypothetical protein